jgi:hypothetical protein
VLGLTAKDGGISVRLEICVILLISSSLFAQNPPDGSNVAAQSGPTNQSNPSNTQPEAKTKNEQPPKAKLKREYTDLSGFDLAAKNETHATQIGGGTRSVGGDTTPYAPNKGRSFDLHPTVSWTDTTKTQKFIVTFKDSSGAVIYQKEISSRAFRYADDGPALKPGSTYLWTAEPSNRFMGRRSEPAEIVIVGEPERSQIRDELNNKRDELSQANVFVEHKLWYDAIEKLSLLIEKQPSSELYERRAEIYEQVSNTMPLASDDRATASQIPAPH